MCGFGEKYHIVRLFLLEEEPLSQYPLSNQRINAQQLLGCLNLYDAFWEEKETY